MKEISLIRARDLRVKFRTTALFSLVFLFALSSPVFSKEVLSSLLNDLPLPVALVSEIIDGAASQDAGGFVVQNSGWFASVYTTYLPGLKGKSLMWEQKRNLSLALVSIVRSRLGKGVSPRSVACPQAWADSLQQTPEMREVSAAIGKGMWSVSTHRDGEIVALVALPENILDVSGVSFSRMQAEAKRLYASNCLKIARERVKSGLLKDAVIPFEEFLSDVGPGVSNDRILEYARILAGAGDTNKTNRTLDALIKNRGDKMNSEQWEEAGNLYYALGEEVRAEKCYNMASGFEAPEKR